MSLEQTRRRRQAVGTIHDIVGAMRAIAAGRIQGAQRALAAARRYQDVVLRALAGLAPQAPARVLPAVNGRPPLLLVLTAEQPFCGSFNQDVLAFAEQRWQELREQGEVRLVVVGQRGARQLLSRGIVPDASEPAATSLHGLRDLVKRLARMTDQRYAAGEVGALHVVYNRYQSVSEQVPTEQRVLPLDVGQTASLSTIAEGQPCRLSYDKRGQPGEYHRYLPIPILLAGLVSEYAFISLYQAAADSFAGEQASRLVAMDEATRNTERMLDALIGLEHRERQGQITREVLELIGARFASE
jgi:F-type H+-transporting ATPase subunit gamma